MTEIQQAGRGPAAAPLGVVYSTAMNRPDAALALAGLYGLEIKRESKVGAVCVTGAGFNAAVFCDVVARFYTGPAKNGNQSLAVGYADIKPEPPVAPMLLPALARTKPTGDPQYARSVSRLGDTSQAEALLRNGSVFNAQSVMVLSAPATALARSLDVLGSKELYQQRIKRLVIIDGAIQQDAAALRRVVSEWPTPVFFVGRDVGEALQFPGDTIDKLFAWAPAHPVVDAYKAFKPMPYNAPQHDLAGIHYAVHPDSGFFTVAGTGTLAVGDDGTAKFSPGSGNVSRLVLDPTKTDAALAMLVAVTGTPVPAPAAPRGRGAA